MRLFVFQEKLTLTFLKESLTKSDQITSNMVKIEHKSYQLSKFHVLLFGGGEG